MGSLPDLESLARSELESLFSDLIRKTKTTGSAEERAKLRRQFRRVAR
jgi:hypothetical protein